MFFGFSGQMAFAGIYFLYPYFTGRMYNQTLGNWHFWLWQIGLFIKITGMGVAGYLYFPRWVYDYLDISGWANAQMSITIGGYMVATGFLFFLVNIFWSAKYGKEVTGDPWPVIHDLKAAPAAAPAE